MIHTSCLFVWVSNTHLVRFIRSIRLVYYFKVHYNGNLQVSCLMYTFSYKHVLFSSVCEHHLSFSLTKEILSEILVKGIIQTFVHTDIIVSGIPHESFMWFVISSAI